MTYSWVQTGKWNQKSQKQLQKAMKSENATSNAANNALDFLKVLYQVFFFPGCYAILKGFSYLLGVKFTGLSNILPVTSWQLTNRTVELYFMLLPTQHMSLAWLQRNVMHWNSLCSLLRTNERSTFSKCKEAVLPNLNIVWWIN